MGLVSKASATRILIASPIALTFDGELDLELTMMVAAVMTVPDTDSRTF